MICSNHGTIVPGNLLCHVCSYSVSVVKPKKICEATKKTDKKSKK